MSCEKLKFKYYQEKRDHFFKRTGKKEVIIFEIEEIFIKSKVK